LQNVVGGLSAFKTQAAGPRSYGNQILIVSAQKVAFIQESLIDLKSQKVEVSFGIKL